MENDLIKTMLVGSFDLTGHDLETMLKPFPDFLIVVSAGCISDAEPAYLKHKPSLIFLDIELSDGSGFQFLDKIKPYSHNLSVVFITAYSNHAFTAIKYSAIDFLVKPIDPVELAMAVEKCRKVHKQELFNLKLTKLISTFHFQKPIKLKSKNGYVMVVPSDIIYCEANWNYTDVYLSENDKQVVTQNMGHFVKRLSEHQFFRLSRSLCINIQYLSKMDLKKKQCLLIKGTTEISLATSVVKLRALARHIDENEWMQHISFPT